MSVDFSLFEFSDRERAALRDAATRDTFHAIDNRADGFADCDPLGDAHRIGQRIADGFAILDKGE
jgi:hypothetical protein